MRRITPDLVRVTFNEPEDIILPMTVKLEDGKIFTNVRIIGKKVDFDKLLPEEIRTTMLLIITNVRKVEQQKGIFLIYATKESKVALLVPEIFDLTDTQKLRELIKLSLKAYGLMPTYEYIKLLDNKRSIIRQNIALVLVRLAAFTSNTLLLAPPGIGKTVTAKPFDVIAAYVAKPTIPSLVYNMRDRKPGVLVTYPIVVIDELLKSVKYIEEKGVFLSALSGNISRGDFIFHKEHMHIVAFDTYTDNEILGLLMKDEAFYSQLFDRFAVIRLHGISATPFTKIKRSTKATLLLLSFVASVDKFIDDNPGLVSVFKQRYNLTHRQAYHVVRFFIALSALMHAINPSIKLASLLDFIDKHGYFKDYAVKIFELDKRLFDILLFGDKEEGDDSYEEDRQEGLDKYFR